MAFVSAEQRLLTAEAILQTPSEDIQSLWPEREEFLPSLHIPGVNDGRPQLDT
ncbi:MAG: hypothetical protein AAF735_07695 [Myxococcota bacterium]